MSDVKQWLSMTSAALVSVVVGFASTVLVIMQAADAVGASSAQKASWATVLSFAMGGLTLLLSWRHKMPMMVAWTTSGAALIATSKGMAYAPALGAFAFAGVLTVATGLIKPVARAIEQIPAAIAAAMLGGVLVSYVLKVPAAAIALPWLVVPLVVLFFALRVWKPLFAVPPVVALGLALAAFQGGLGQACCDVGLAHLTFDWPELQWQALISIGLPLYLVTMASQNLPGFAVMRSFGYQPPVSSALITTGLGSALMSPFGGPQVNMAAITASLAMGPDVHPDPAQRWKIAIPYAIIYFIVGLGAALFVNVLGALPHQLVLAMAGLALFAPLMGAMTAMMKDAKDIEPALLTFLVTASGMSFYGIGPAFWGLVAGLTLWGAKRRV
jgi:benzoate membrane transport protein